MNVTRFLGVVLILIGVGLWTLPYYGYQRAMWHVALAIVAAIAGATLLFRGRELGA